MHIITQARYRVSPHDDFSGNILLDATDISYIKEFIQKRRHKDTWENKIANSKYYEIELNDIAQYADDDLRNRWHKGEYVYFQLVINDKYILETKSTVSFHMAKGSSNVSANILKDKVSRWYTFRI